MWARLSRIAVASLVGGLLSIATASETQTVTEIGVSIHGIKDPRELDLMVEAGVKWVRFDLTWERIERRAGEYDWGQYDALVASIAERKLRPLMILAYSNSNYEDAVDVRKSGGPRVWSRTAAPADDRGIEAYSRWAAEAARRYSAHRPMLELWNEPDHDFFWPPRSDPGGYSKLARSACKAIKAVEPDAYVIGPGAAHVPDAKGQVPEFLQRVIGSGLIDCLDGVSLHPYLARSAIDTTPVVWEATRAAIQSHVKQDKQKKGETVPHLISSEWGLSTYSKRISEQERAAYLAKMLVLNSAAGVKVSVWYNLRDNGEDGSAAENRFGLIDTSFRPYPAWQALKAFSQVLGGASVLCSRPSANPSALRTYFKTPDGGVVAAVWAQGSPKLNEVLPRSASPLGEILDVMGRPMGPRGAEDLRVGVEPVYVRLSPATPQGANPCN